MIHFSESTSFGLVIIIQRSWIPLKLSIAEKLSYWQTKNIYQAWKQVCAQFWRPPYCGLLAVTETFCCSDLFYTHVASHLFILLHAICFLVERFQVLLIPFLISHGKQFIMHLDLNHLDSCGVGNSSCLSLIFGKCFNGISKLCYYEVLMETHTFFFHNDKWC